VHRGVDLSGALRRVHPLTLVRPCAGAGVLHSRSRMSRIWVLLLLTGCAGRVDDARGKSPVVGTRDAATKVDAGSGKPGAGGSSAGGCAAESCQAPACP